VIGLHEIIYTIEDPIEYKIDFVTQYQINEASGFTFSEGMKSIMRQDPDVIVIGEMRDRESIFTGLKAAHSGHMVFPLSTPPTALWRWSGSVMRGGSVYPRLLPQRCRRAATRS
jgi:Tfp pilus assembly pilus retraction ATPase PilT